LRFSHNGFGTEENYIQKVLNRQNRLEAAIFLVIQKNRFQSYSASLYVLAIDVLLVMASRAM
jgi:hypothetical protein